MTGRDPAWPGARRRGKLAGAITAVVVIGIVYSGIAIGRSVGDGIEEKVAPVPPRRNVARAEPLRPTPGAGFYWGAYRDGAPYDRSLIEELETEVGRRPSLVMWYQEWHGSQAFPASEVAWLAKQGIVPVISWEPWRPPVVFGDLVVEQPDYALARIAGGSFDKYIRAYADGVRDYGGPIMIRPFHEMDGTWYPWGGHENGNTPTDFVRAWRHVHDLFEEAGATNVTWVWSVNHLSVPDTQENQISNYWPGDRYVDWTGMSGFNWGRASPLSVWKGIDAVIGSRYRDLLAYRKPIALMETGAPEKGGDKSAWISSTLANLGENYPGLDAVIWYDRRDSADRDWRIGSTRASLAAFRAAITAPHVLAGDSAQSTTAPGSSRGAEPFSDGFGRDALGPAWTCTRTRGQPVGYAGDGGRAVISLPQGTSRSTCLIGDDFADVDARVRVAWASAGTGRMRNESALVVRASHDARNYSFALSEGDGRSGSAIIRRTALGQVDDLAKLRLPFAVEGGREYEIFGRARTIATGVRLQMRVYLVGTVAPETWTLSVTDGARQRLARGRTGFALSSDDGPMSAYVDAFSVR